MCDCSTRSRSLLLLNTVDVVNTLALGYKDSRMWYLKTLDLCSMFELFDSLIDFYKSSLLKVGLLKEGVLRDLLNEAQFML